MARELLIEEVEMDRSDMGKFLWLTHVFMRYVFYNLFFNYDNISYI